MHVISRKKLRQFWAVHADAEAPLQAWFRLARGASWRRFADVRSVCRTADQVGRFAVFNIAGNKYRLVAVIHYNRGKIYVRHVLTHQEYDLGHWKDD